MYNARKHKEVISLALPHRFEDLEEDYRHDFHSATLSWKINVLRQHEWTKAEIVSFLGISGREYESAVIEVTDDLP